MCLVFLTVSSLQLVLAFTIATLASFGPGLPTDQDQKTK